MSSETVEVPKTDLIRLIRAADAGLATVLIRHQPETLAETKASIRTLKKLVGMFDLDSFLETVIKRTPDHTNSGA